MSSVSSLDESEPSRVGAVDEVVSELLTGVAFGGRARSKEGSRGDSEIDDGVLTLDFEGES